MERHGRSRRRSAPGDRGSRPAVLTLVATVLLAVFSQAELPDPAPQALLVRDPVFSLLVGYVRDDHFGVLTRDDVGRVLTERKASSRLPWRKARDLARVPDTSGAAAALTIRFDGPLDVAIPYSILWYNPGTIRASAVGRAREWRVATLEIEAPAGWKGAPIPHLTDVHLFALDEGQIVVDIDGWVDALLGGALDDMILGGFAFARQGSREYAFATGHNRKGESRIGVFDLSADAIVFPIPKDLRATHRAIRRKLEQLAAPPAAPV